MSRIETAETAYITAFRMQPPRPYAISDDRLAEVLEQAVVDGKPIPDSFDWWADLPPDALA